MDEIESNKIFATSFSCLLYRIIGSLLTITSIITVLLTIHYFIRRFIRQRKNLRVLPLSPILIGMLISLFLILCTGFPLILIQCFTCRPLKTYIMICKINAFICFAIGNFNMYMLVLLSIFRYINIVRRSNSSRYFFEHHRCLSVIICALISLCWSLPPLLNVGNTFMNDGIGFQCSLDWNNSAFQSRLFLYSLLICNYLLLLIILIYSNLRIYLVLRRLIKANKSFNTSLTSTIIHFSHTNTNSFSNCICHSPLDTHLRKSISDRQLTRKLSRLQRLKIDQRYAHITAIMVTQFIIGWTPYAILALIVINGGIELVRRYPMFSNISELMAKFSLIFNPLILIYTNKMREN